MTEIREKLILVRVTLGLELSGVNCTMLKNKQNKKLLEENNINFVLSLIRFSLYNK